MSFSSPCLNENLHVYAITYELYKETFAVKSQNIKHTIGIQVTFLLQIKLQKYIF